MTRSINSCWLEYPDQTHTTRTKAIFLPFLSSAPVACWVSLSEEMPPQRPSSMSFCLVLVNILGVSQVFFAEHDLPSFNIRKP